MRTCLLVLTAMATTGCLSELGEQHFFKSVDALGNPINYYRLSVQGSTVLTSARYVSGYFDERAVAAYFSEMAQPAKAKFEDTVADDGQVVALDPKGRDRQLVLLLSSNSDEIANQIGGLAQNEEIAATLTRLAQRDTLRDARRADVEWKAQRSRGQLLQDLGDKVIAG